MKPRARFPAGLLLAFTAACGPAAAPPAPPAPPADSTAVADSVIAAADTLPPAAAWCVPAERTAAEPRAEVLWDTWGIPHIFAEDLPALFHAFGWAQMKSHGDLLLRLYGQARGRAAEYWGPAYADGDRWVLTNGVPARARDWVGQMPPHMRAYLEAFADGINGYAADHADCLDDAVEPVLPVTAADILAHVQRVIHFTFIANPQLAGGPGGGGDSPGAGSNAWAVAPARSESGNALLLANPHLPWGDLFTWYEAQLVAPGLDAYGAALVGFPLPGIAFNDHLGWTHTVNTIDAMDLYALTPVEGGYAWDGGVRPFEIERHTLRVRQPDGTMTEQVLEVRRSVHGPVIGERNGQPIAMRVAGLDRPHLMEQTWEMLRADDLAQFESALARQQIPMFTVLYADADGHILHVFNGAVPVRPFGDWSDWADVVRGDTSGTLWTTTHAYSDLPRVLDPASGWLQNANDPPWTTTFPTVLDPVDYPAYMAPRMPLAFRPQRSARLLAENRRISFDEMVRDKHDTRAEAADHILEDVLIAARTYGDDLAKRAAAVLAEWDRTTNADSRGAILFEALMRELARRPWATGSPFDVPWTRTAPFATPDGLSDPAGAAEALTAAARLVEERYDTLGIAWGEAHRLRRDSLDLPANGGPGGLGVFRVTQFDDDADGRSIANFGDSWVAVIEFSQPVHAVALLSYGNESQPLSPHRIDQLPLYARKELRPVWRTRAEVEANLERTDRF
ncbi:MAG: acylase [Longimicrobiales bacterium]